MNVFLSSFPDIAQIPAATALNLPLVFLPAFTLADAVTPQLGMQEAAIQYNNGRFNGLFYISDFTYKGSPYELQIQGGALSIVTIIGGYPTFNSLVNGYVNFSLSNPQSYTPPISTTPLPAALPLFATGLGAMGLFGWRKKRKLPPLSQRSDHLHARGGASHRRPSALPSQQLRQRGKVGRHLPRLVPREQIDFLRSALGSQPE